MMALAQLVEIHFENKRLQVNSPLKTLFLLQSIAQESGAALKEFQRTIHSSKKNHPVRICTRFLQMSVEDRLGDFTSIALQATINFRIAQALTTGPLAEVVIRLHRTSGSTTASISCDSTKPVSALIPHIISSVSVICSVPLYSGLLPQRP